MKSDLELLQIELLAERRLRDLLQQKLNATEQARRALERERDLYRVFRNFSSFIAFLLQLRGRL